MTSASFIFSGNTPLDSDRLKMYVNGFITEFLICLSRLLLILSYPELSFEGNLFMKCLISVGVIGSKYIIFSFLFILFKNLVMLVSFFSIFCASFAPILE